MRTFLFLVGFSFFFLTFEIDKCDWSPRRQNSWKSLYFRKSFKECIFFFFFGNTVEFLSLDHMRLWASRLSFWRVDRTEASPGGESSEFMAGSTCQCASVYGVTAKLKPYPLLCTEWQPPDWTSLCPAFCISLRQCRRSGLLRIKLFLFISIWFCSVRESELSSLLLLLKGLNWAEVKTGFVSHSWCIKVLIVMPSEKAMAPHSSTLAWKIPWTEEPGRLQSMGLRRVGHNWATSLSLFTFMH